MPIRSANRQDRAMTDSPPPPSGAAPPPGDKARRRPAATIDLTATEVASGPVAAAEAAAAQAQEPEASLRGNEGPPRAGAETARGGAPAQDWQAALSRLRSMMRSPPSGPWALVAAAVAGGLVVFLAFMIAGSGSRDAGNVGPLDARLSRVEAALRDLSARPAPAESDAKAMADLTGRIAKLEAAAANSRPPAADPALLNRLSTLEGNLKALGETVAIVGRRSDEATTIAREAQKRADANAAAIAALAQKIARSGAAAVERSEVDALTRRLAALEQSGKAVETELAKRPAGGTRDQVARVAFAAAALWSAVERGDPFASELAAMKSLAVAPEKLAPLAPFAASGVPAAAALARELTNLAPALYQAAGGGPRDASFLEKLQASAEKLVRIRPIAEVPGDDAAAIVARAEAKAARADIAGALGELAQLPASARAPAQAWIEKAEARQAAIDAGRRLAGDALAALGK
jgi:hypothetical protein